MKKLYLTLFFTVYHIFMPFVLLNCATSDTPYVRESTTASEDAESSDALAECEAQEFLTADCVELMQAEEERAESEDETIAAAYEDIPTFLDCQQQSAATEAAEGEESLDCDGVVGEVLDGYESCQAEFEDAASFECDQILERVSEASEKCEAGETDVTADFCALLV